MTEQIILDADPRERTGSNKARVIRKVDGMVPAIVYGDEKETLNLKLKLNETIENEDYRDPIEVPNKKIPRNAICPLCNSGKKYKHCCGKY